MSTIGLRVPEPPHRQARELAEQEGISINYRSRAMNGNVPRYAI